MHFQMRWLYVLNPGGKTDRFHDLGGIHAFAPPKPKGAQR